MNKIISFVVTLLLCLITMACGKNVQQVAQEMQAEVNAAGEAKNMEQTEKVYQKYYDLFKEMSPDDQVEFIKLTIFEYKPTAKAEKFFQEHAREIQQLECVRNFSDSLDRVYLKNIDYFEKIDKQTPATTKD